jgi:two-component system, NarL family, nitrate/nitrite response regulator NarL
MEDMLLEKVTPTERIEVVLALRNQLARYGIEKMLQSVDIVTRQRSYDDLTTALDTVAGVGAACELGTVVVVVALREIDGDAPLGLRAAAERGVKVLFLLDELDRRKLSRVAPTDGSGFMFADELGAGTLRQTLTRLRDGEMPMSARLTRSLLTTDDDGGLFDGGGRSEIRITPRERHVLTLLVEGLSNKQIARRLDISDHGAKRHVANILAKLNCPNRTLAVAKALREGLCVLP